MELDFSLLVEIVGGAVVLVGVPWGALKFIDARITKRLKDPEVVQSIARFIRPAVIFDEEGSILVDQGGMEHIALDGIEVKREPFAGNSRGLVVEIQLRPNRILSTAPLLECLDDDAEITATRGEGADWIYHLKHAHVIAFVSSPPQTQPHRFRVEILL